MSKDIKGPVDKVTNIVVELGPRMLMVGSEVLGTTDNISIHVAEATEEELEKLKSAYRIQLVKRLGENGPGEGAIRMPAFKAPQIKCPYCKKPNPVDVARCIHCRRTLRQEISGDNS